MGRARDLLGVNIDRERCVIELQGFGRSFYWTAWPSVQVVRPRENEAWSCRGEDLRGPMMLLDHSRGDASLSSTDYAVQALPARCRASMQEEKIQWTIERGDKTMDGTYPRWISRRTIGGSHPCLQTAIFLFAGCLSKAEGEEQGCVLCSQRGRGGNSS